MRHIRRTWAFVWPRPSRTISREGRRECIRGRGAGNQESGARSQGINALGEELFFVGEDGAKVEEHGAVVDAGKDCRRASAQRVRQSVRCGRVQVERPTGEGLTGEGAAADRRLSWR